MKLYTKHDIIYKSNSKILDIQSNENLLYIKRLNDTILFNLNNKKSNTINHLFDKISLSNTKFIGLKHDLLGEEIFIWDIQNCNQINGLNLNLDKNDKVIKIATNKESIYIITLKGTIYEFNIQTKIIDTICSNDAYEFEIANISDDKQTIIIFGKRYNEYHCCILYYLNSDDHKIYLSSEMSFLNYLNKNNASSNLVHLDIFKNELLAISINKKVSIFGLTKNKINLLDTIDVKESIMNIKFHPSFNNYLIIYTEKTSEIYYSECENVEYNKINEFNNKIFFRPNDLNIYLINSETIFLYHPTKNLFKHLIEPLQELKSSFESYISSVNLNNNLSLYNQNNLPYDFVFECSKIDYQKRIHSFVLFSKINLKIYNLKEILKIKKFNLKSNYDQINHELLDEFLKYLYTDILPDTALLIENLDFFEEISEHILPIRQNNLYVWIRKIKGYCKSNNIIQIKNVK